MKRPFGPEKQNGIFPVIRAINVTVTALLSAVLSLFRPNVSTKWSVAFSTCMEGMPQTSTLALYNGHN